MKTSEEVRLVWRKAAIELSIEFHSPFEVLNDGQTISFDGFLPEFGGLNGMVFVIDETFNEDRSEEVRIAELSGYYFSRINAQTYIEFSLELFHEALRDWGWYGEQAKKPPWMTTRIALSAKA